VTEHVRLDHVVSFMNERLQVTRAPIDPNVHDGRFLSREDALQLNIPGPSGCP